VRIIKTTGITVFLCLVFLATIVTFAVAQEVQEPAEKREHLKGYDDWHFSLNLYSWLYALKGNVAAKGTTSSVDVRLDDTLKLLDEIRLVLMGRYEVSKGPWGVLLDGMFLRMEDRAADAKQIQIPILVPSELTLQGRAKVTMDTSINEAAVSYDVYTSPCLVGNMPGLVLEVLSGARYTYLRAKIDLKIQGAGGTLTRDTDKSKEWVDPFLGGRVVWRPSEKWLMAFRTDVGGFNVSSNLTLNLNAEVAYRINKLLFLNVGYRALYDNYETGSGDNRFAYKMWIYGPWMGVGVDF